MRKSACLILLILALPAFGQDLFPNPAVQMAATQQAMQNSASLAMQQSEQGEASICEPERLSLSAPKFSIKPGMYTRPQHVKIIELNRSATIHYTTDGSIPTQFSPKFTLRHRPIPIVSSTRLQAIALACEGHSPIASALYTLPPQPPKPAPQPALRPTSYKPGS